MQDPICSSSDACEQERQRGAICLRDSIYFIPNIVDLYVQTFPSAREHIVTNVSIKSRSTQANAVIVAEIIAGIRST